MATIETQKRLHLALAALIREAHEEGIEIAGWLAAGLGAVAESLPGRADALLAKRPGSWESALVRRLVTGTMGD